MSPGYARPATDSSIDVDAVFEKRIHRERGDRLVA
jgi:hypothetical protein